jgi:methylenetetrahydrofolate reductase (NADPH)
VFETEKHARFLDIVKRAQIDIPIVPGIMPTTNFKGTKRMAERCGASIPQWLEDYYIGLDDELETRKLIAAYVAAEQVNRLRAYGFERFHFYTLNQADLTFAICNVLGIRRHSVPVPVPVA